eukprot:TRINITY_DN2670_c0_g2_i2.p1 TRINITY_DN2670_c0_g2~~TRINITY_DN2670_c0_g2_i2.p1  ORF type:complete len:124 (-),score=45.10 TRINITY_DN2670_c0_g2_i2:42-374(-)
MGVEKTLIKAGSGPEVTKGARITVHCTGYLAAGKKKFWSTKDPGQQTFTFQCGVGQVIKGWDQGCLGMRLGESSSLLCSPDFAYGAAGFPAWGIPPNSPLIFEIEILKIN